MSESEDKHWYYAAARFNERPFRPYATAIGQSTLAWNSLQEALGGLFWTLMGEDRRGRAMAVWQSLKADRPKRDMLTAALANMPESFHVAFPTAKADISWLIKEATKLEDARNNTVHAPLQVSAPLSAFRKFGPRTIGKQRREIPAEAIVIPQDWNMNERASRLAGKNILAEYRRCHKVAVILRDYATHLAFALAATKTPWPERPKLPNRGETSGT